MHENSLPAITDRYLKRFGFAPQLLKNPPHPDTKLAVVIPCYDEPELTKTLQSLSECAPPEYPVEVLVVINSGLAADEEVKWRNQQSLEQAEQWKAAQKKDWLKTFILYVDDMPAKHAGVGLARKLGMDEALRRFASIDYTGMIVCLDADCTVASNYLQALESVHVTRQPQSCAIHFEHILAEAETPVLQEGILYYELFLRYYVNALAYAGYPFAMHTVGSSMSVRADTYALSGGMNRRKAGEDFYFLHKVVPLGDFYAINETTVYPSARLSDRVPFGTGRAQHDWLKGQSSRKYTYHPDTFEALKEFLKLIPAFYEDSNLDEELSAYDLATATKEFLKTQAFTNKLKELKENSSSFKSFKKRFFLWFDGFKTLKFVHYCRDEYQMQWELSLACQQLLLKLGLDCAADVKELLLAFRRLDKDRKPVNLMLT